MSEQTRYQILLVEDNQPNILAATALLEMLGYSYLVATNGIEAIKLFLKHSFDVILMDIQMPSLSGIDTAELIRAIEVKFNTRTPIVAVTALMHKADMGKLDTVGIDDLIPKPFHPDHLARALKKYAG